MTQNALTPMQFACLKELSGCKPNEAYAKEIVRRMEGRWGNNLEGTVYSTLNRLDEKGFVTSSRKLTKKSSTPIRFYKFTKAGRDSLKAAEKAFAA